VQIGGLTYLAGADRRSGLDGHALRALAERAVAKTTNVVAFTRKRPARQPFPLEN
jgi:hypothetical protein